jgi:hypothetical protein
MKCCVAFTCKLLYSFNLCMCICYVTKMPFDIADDRENSLTGVYYKQQLRCKARYIIRLSAEQILLLCSLEKHSNM